MKLRVKINDNLQGEPHGFYNLVRERSVRGKLFERQVRKVDDGPGRKGRAKIHGGFKPNTTTREPAEIRRNRSPADSQDRNLPPSRPLFSRSLRF